VRKKIASLIAEGEKQTKSISQFLD